MCTGTHHTDKLEPRVGSRDEIGRTQVHRIKAGLLQSVPWWEVKHLKYYGRLSTFKRNQEIAKK